MVVGQGAREFRRFVEKVGNLIGDFVLVMI